MIEETTIAEKPFDEVRHANDPFEPGAVKVVKREQLAPNVQLLTVHAPVVANKIKPGQFVIVMSHEQGERIPLTVSFRPVAAVGWLIVFGSIIGFSAYLFLLENVRPALASSYAYVNPAVAVALGILFAGEEITVIGVTAMVIISAGVILVALGQRWRT